MSSGSGRSVRRRSRAPSCDDPGNPLYSARASSQHSIEAPPLQPASGGSAAAPRAHIIPNPIRQYPVAAQAGAAERSQAFDAERHHERTTHHIRHHHARRRAEPRRLDDQGGEAAHCTATGTHARGCDRGGLPGFFERRFRGGGGGGGGGARVEGGRAVARPPPRRPTGGGSAVEGGNPAASPPPFAPTAPHLEENADEPPAR